MLIAIRVVRVLVGLVAAWQVLGLLPVLTTWLPNAHDVTGGMWAIALIKFLVMLVCAGIYFWLGRVKSRFDDSGGGASDGRIITLSIVALAGVGLILAVAIPAFSDRAPVTANTAPPPAQPTVVAPTSAVPQYAAPPTFESEGWTQESTGSTVAEPWLAYDPPGTRYSRLADGTIYRFFPPGVRPSAEKANPFALGGSTDRPPSN